MARVHDRGPGTVFRISSRFAPRRTPAFAWKAMRLPHRRGQNRAAAADEAERKVVEDAERCASGEFQGATMSRGRSLVY